MKQTIDILIDTIKNNNHSEGKSRDIELLLKATAIEILKPHAESKIGFAMEAIGKIAASSYSRNSQLNSSIDDIARVLAMSLENKDTNNE